MKVKRFHIEDVISWSNSEDAKKYIEQQGYFGNSVQDLVTKVKENSTSRLWNVWGADEVHCIFEDIYDIRYGLFLPLDKVYEVDENDL